MSSIQRDTLFNVDGMVAVITGGGTGIGLMMARGLAENGASKVYIMGRRESKLKEAAALHPSIIPLVGDVTSKESLQAAAARVQQETGYINLLIANAGMSGPMLDKLRARHSLAEFVDYAWKTPMEEFSEVYNMNCTATYYTILAFLNLLDAGNQRGSPTKSQVIATASTASFLRNPRAGFAYLSSKAGVVSMLKSFSTFCVPFGIRFNIIAAGLFPSDMSEPLFAPFKIDKEKAIDEEGAFARSYQPAERAGKVDDMAGTVLYLASRAGSFVNGSVMLVDGGKIATMPATY
ncbi:hypothetical protein EYZ11_002948 [Aspergillus tanneri]|uniref:Uncharacterized protein n=1 Tax=Aspergillus tanneri TaxID=1220188 RepID=A0A4S3JPI8_9EURO|nr:uncharacterized protein ATNIH1004_009522 [Aspergillus tanneri]KAA8642770.1 hypothetical protein ATNIH1004_009522 [Aspergillus tanneri]THC97593.1 hypothetical protein EYZ11_002948 [Aspergillus tanneri]